MAQADRQTAPKLVYLEVVTTALRKLGLSEESITRGIFRGCGDGSLSYHHTGEDPPPGFWRTGLGNVRINASDISNLLILPASAGAVGFYTFTLFDVMLAWEDVVVKYPALRDTEPPELGTSHVEVSFAAPFMKRLEVVMTWLGTLLRKPPLSAEEEPKAPAPASTRLQEMERAGFFKGARALQDAADYAREAYSLDGCVPDDVTPAQFARGLEKWLKARNKVKVVPDQWHTSNRFLREYRHQS